MTKIKVEDVLSGKKYHIDKKLGEGAFGAVYRVCSNDVKNCEYVLKKQLVKDIKHIENEEKMHKMFSKHKLSPSFYDSITIKEGKKNYAYCLMERVDGVVEQLITPHTTEKQLLSIATALFELIDKMCKYKLIHGDLHSGNIGYIVDTNKQRLHMKLIDFGWSSRGKCNPQLELLQFLRTLHMTTYKPPKELSRIEKKYAKESFNKNIEFLEQIIYKIYTTIYDTNLKNSRRDWESKYNKMMDDYADSF